MRQKDIQVGGRYITYVSGERVEVEVVQERRDIRGRTRYYVRRTDNGKYLPKFRSPQALHPSREGAWPSMMEPQEHLSGAGGGSFYRSRINDALTNMGRDEIDWRHVEAYMRLEHGTLDDLGPRQFDRAVEESVEAIDADPDLAEELAESYSINGVGTVRHEEPGLQRASRQFGKKIWLLERRTQPGGPPFNRLTDGERVDYPVRYHDGHITYDHPEDIPSIVRTWTARILSEWARGGRGVSGAREEEYERPSAEEIRENEALIGMSRDGRYVLGVYGRLIGTHPTLEKTLGAFQQWTEDNNVYPNLYFINDHGNVDLLDHEGNVLASWV